jgi:hypothetical protein
LLNEPVTTEPLRNTDTLVDVTTVHEVRLSAALVTGVVDVVLESMAIRAPSRPPSIRQLQVKISRPASKVSMISTRKTGTASAHSTIAWPRTARAPLTNLSARRPSMCN